MFSNLTNRIFIVCVIIVIVLHFIFAMLALCGINGKLLGCLFNYLVFIIFLMGINIRLLISWRYRKSNEKYEKKEDF